MNVKPDWWYEKKLLEHFNKYYFEYEDIVEWLVNPNPRTWKFYIPGLELTVELRCNTNGQVTEKRYLGADSQ